MGHGYRIPAKGISSDWQPHYQRLKCEGKITVTSISSGATVDLACLVVGCSLLPLVLHMGLLKGGWPFQINDSSSAFNGI